MPFGGFHSATPTYLTYDFPVNLIDRPRAPPSPQGPLR
jgi:hypothetical protein